jgi:hypothetical protein
MAPLLLYRPHYVKEKKNKVEYLVRDTVPLKIAVHAVTKNVNKQHNVRLLCPWISIGQEGVSRAG